MNEPIEYGDNVMLLFSYHQNRLEWMIKRFTVAMVFIAILMTIFIPVTIMFAVESVDSIEYWEVTGKHESFRPNETLERGEYPYYLKVTRDGIVLMVDVPWDMYESIKIGDRIKLDSDCERVIGVKRM
jgi:hypothetical protein